MSINLKKNQSVAIGETKTIKVGLGWDTKCDLDAYAYIYGYCFLTECVCFRNKTSNDGSVRLSGDNLTGVGEGDDEIIYIDTEKLDKRVNEIVFKVKIYSGVPNFLFVKGAYIRIEDENGVELCRHKIGKGFEAFKRVYTFGKLVRNGDRWTFIAK